MFLRDYILNRSSERLGPFVVLQLLTLALLCLLGYLRYDIAGIFMVLGGLTFLLAVSWRVETFPLLFLVYIGLFPNSAYGPQFGVLPVFFYPYMILPFLVAMYVIFLLGRNLSSGPIQAGHQKRDMLGILILVFLALIILQTFRGMALGYPIKFIRVEVWFLSLYTAYFFWRAMFRMKGNMRWWLTVVGLIGAAVAIEYIFLVTIAFKDIVSFVFFRFVTRQGQMTAAAFPILAALFLAVRSWKYKIAFASGMLLIVVQILLSQQRILWGALGLEVFLFFSFFMFRKGFHAEAWLRWFLIIFGVTGFFIAILFLGSWFFGVDLTFLLTRWQDVQSLTDKSFLMRVYDARRALNLVGDRWLTGLGIGSHLRVTPTSQLYFYFDISYLEAYFKGGVPFAILMVSIYVMGLQRAFKVYRNAADESTKLIGAAIFTALAGQMFSGLTAVGMLYYRFIFLWVMLMAAAVVLYERLPMHQGTQEAHTIQDSW